MSLLKCPECGSEVSDQAEHCPKCGYPVAKILDAKRNNDSDSKSEEAASVYESADSQSSDTQNKGSESTKDQKRDISTSKESTSSQTDDKKKKTMLIAGIAGAIVLLLIIILIIVNCSGTPASEKVKSISASYKNSTSVVLDTDSYADLVGTTPQDSSFEIKVTFEDGHTDIYKGKNYSSTESSSSKSSSSKSTSSSSASKDVVNIEIEAVSGPVPLKNNETTTYEIKCDEETCELTILGVEVDSISGKFTGSTTTEGTELSTSSFKLDVNYSNGSKTTATPEKVEGAPLVAGSPTIYTLTYHGKTTTVEVTGTAKPAPTTSTTPKESTSSSSQGAEYKSTCNSVTYHDLVVLESKWVGASVKFKGKVKEVLGSGVVTNAYLVYMTQDGNAWSDPVYMDVTSSHLSRPLKAGDVCEFYGDYDGRVSGSSIGVSGMTTKIPSLAVDYVDIL